MRMLRTLRATVLATVVGLTLTVAAPAEAHTNVCVGHGTFTTAGPMFYVGFGGPTVTSFSMVFPTVGQCVSGPQPEFFTGTVVGNCGLATGVGTTATGHAFNFTWVGQTLTFSGQVNGELHIVEDSASGQSCVTGARRFLVSGGLLLDHN